MMNHLHIYPTSRAIRSIRQLSKEREGFLPTLMRMDEFEKRAVLVSERGQKQIDPLQRILLLREASRFEDFSLLKVDYALVRFFTKSDALFKFFEELSAEHVPFDTLIDADPYAEFETHIKILKELRRRYQMLLAEKGLTDTMFLPESYRLNEGFLKGYAQIDIYLEGYLSLFELELLEKITAYTTVQIHYVTTRFNRKMLARFQTCGIELEENRAVCFDLGKKCVLTSKENHQPIHASLFSVEERVEQVALAFVKIEEMVRKGIAPEEIVLILPDEGFKEYFMLFDKQNNLNFAMGYDYRNKPFYKMVEALYLYRQTPNQETRQRLAYYGLSLEKIEAQREVTELSCSSFFSKLAEIIVFDKKESETVEEKYYLFERLFENEILGYTEWLYLWLKTLSEITIDDVGGGKITVMGVLETRGISFRGVVIVDFNEGIVPAVSGKDMFLNSTVRAFAGLPTKADREALQKQYYHRLLQQAEEAVLCYCTSENRLPSKFLYELKLSNAIQTKAPLQLLYPCNIIANREADPKVEQFDAFAQTWSPARLKVWLECKRKYYYRYLLNINAKEEQTLNEGAFLHTLLEQLYQEQNFYQTQEVLTQRLHSIMEKLLPQQDAQSRYRKLLWQEKLKGFVAKEIAHFQAGWRVVAREVNIAGEIGGLKFKGRIDRIDQNQSDTLILDYKSGRVEKEPKKLNPDKITDFQMSIYQHLLEKNYRNLSLAFIKIFEKGEKQHLTLLEERKALLAEHLVTLKQTNAFVATKCDDLQKCTYCEFTLLCQRGKYL